MPTTTRVSNYRLSPYAYDALEPHIDKRTMEIHYGKHHQGYVNKLNAAIARSHDLMHMSLEGMLRNIDRVPETRSSIRYQ